MSAPSKGGASRDGYGSALLKLADDPRVVVLEADLGKSTKSCLFRAEYPERTVSMGIACLLYTSPSPRDGLLSRMPSSA